MLQAITSKQQFITMIECIFQAVANSIVYGGRSRGLELEAIDQLNIRNCGHLISWSGASLLMPSDNMLGCKKVKTAGSSLGNWLQSSCFLSLSVAYTRAHTPPLKLRLLRCVFPDSALLVTCCWMPAGVPQRVSHSNISRERKRRKRTIDFYTKNP